MREQYSHQAIAADAAFPPFFTEPPLICTLSEGLFRVCLKRGYYLLFDVIYAHFIPISCEVIPDFGIANIFVFLIYNVGFFAGITKSFIGGDQLISCAQNVTFCPSSSTTAAYVRKAKALYTAFTHLYSLS